MISEEFKFSFLTYFSLPKKENMNMGREIFSLPKFWPKTDLNFEATNVRAQNILYLYITTVQDIEK